MAHELVTATLGQLWAFWDFELNIPAYNPGREDKASWGTPEAQIPPDMFRGYDLKKGAMAAIPIKQVGELLKIKDPVKEAMEQRKQRIEAWRNATGAVSFLFEEEDGKPVSVDITYAQAASVLERYAKVKPEWAVMAGQRRFYALPFTIALREAKLPKEPEYTVALEALAYTGDSDALFSQLLYENRDNAKQGYSEVGMIRNAIRLLDRNYRLGEADIGRMLSLADHFDPVTKKPTTMKRGLRQKVFRAAKLALKHKSLDIGKRLDVDPEYIPAEHPTMAGKLKYVEGGYIPVAKLDKEDSWALLGKRKENTNSVLALTNDKSPPEGGYDSAIVEKWLESVITGSAPKRKGYSDKDAKALLDSARVTDSVAKVGDVLKALTSGDATFFNPIAEGGKVGPVDISKVRKVSAPIGDVYDAILRGDQKFFDKLAPKATAKATK